MELTRAQKLGLASAIVMTAFAVGRYTTPVKVKIETKTVEVEKRVEVQAKDQDIKTHKKITQIEDSKPSGEKVVTTVTDEDYDNNSSMLNQSSLDRASEKDQSKLVQKDMSQWHINAMAGITTAKGQAFGGSVSKDILGPISIGIFGLSCGVGGVTVGIRF